MNFQLKHRGLECPPDIEEAIREKTQRFKRLVDDNGYMELELKQLPRVQHEGDKEAEVILDIPGQKPVLRFVAQGQTLLEAVDKVLDKLDQAVSQHHDRRHDHSYAGRSPKEWLADEMNKEEM